MRIVSLLPSLTELVCALGHERDLVGVTHECDFPPGVERLPHLTRSQIPGSASSAEIDAMVAEQAGSLYALDTERLSASRPHLILTQEQCDVCAVNEATVRRAAERLPGHPHVESVNPTSLAGVLAMFRRVAELLGAQNEAEALIASFRATATEIAHRRSGRSAPGLVLLEWFDPPFASGHWNPELIALAGGTERLARAGERSRRLAWGEVAAAEPDVILLAPCGFTLERSEAELPRLQSSADWASLAAVRSGRAFLADGSAYFSRPGPRLEASLRIAAAAVDPETCGELAPAGGWKRLPALS